MDVERAIRTAKEWGRSSGNGLCKFAEKRMVVDEIHLFRLVVEIVIEKKWLLAMLGDKDRIDSEGVIYSKQDLKDFHNLLDVISKTDQGVEL